MTSIRFSTQQIYPLPYRMMHLHFIGSDTTWSGDDLLLSFFGGDIFVNEVFSVRFNQGQRHGYQHCSNGGANKRASGTARRSRPCAS